MGLTGHWMKQASFRENLFLFSGVLASSTKQCLILRLSLGDRSKREVICKVEREICAAGHGGDPLPRFTFG